MNSSSKNKKTWGKKNTRIQRRRDINAICFIGKPQEVKEKKENSIIQIAQTHSFPASTVGYALKLQRKHMHKVGLEHEFVSLSKAPMG